MLTNSHVLYSSSPTLFLSVLLLFSCGRFIEGNHQKTEPSDGKNGNTHNLSPEITLDIDGDGLPETAEIMLIREATGNPMEGGDPAEYAVSFGNSGIPLLPVGCCEGYLISEGDLNNTDGEEFSLVQSPVNGCTYTLRCFTYSDAEWKEVLEPILIPTACEGLSEQELEDRIVREGKAVFFYDSDPNDETGGLIRKRLIP